MNIRGPVAALTILFMLTGCGPGMRGCARVLETEAYKAGSVAKEIPVSKSIEFAPQHSSDDLGAAAHGRAYEDFGNEIAKEGLKHSMEAIKHRDDDKKRDDDQRKQ